MSRQIVHLPSLIPFVFILSNNRYTYREVFMEGLRQVLVVSVN
ncbi:TPA: hypothetical protein ACGOTT_001425 [Streptococcus suis]